MMLMLVDHDAGTRNHRPAGRWLVATTTQFEKRSRTPEPLLLLYENIHVETEKVLCGGQGTENRDFRNMGGVLKAGTVKPVPLEEKPGNNASENTRRVEPTNRSCRRSFHFRSLDSHRLDINPFAPKRRRSALSRVPKTTSPPLPPLPPAPTRRKRTSVATMSKSNQHVILGSNIGRRNVRKLRSTKLLRRLSRSAIRTLRPSKTSYYCHRTRRFLRQRGRWYIGNPPPPWSLHHLPPSPRRRTES